MPMIPITMNTSNILDAIGDPANGTISIRPNAPWFYDSIAGKTKVNPKPVLLTVSSGKITAPISLQLAPTNGGGVNIVDASYTATFTLDNTPIYSETWLIDGNAGGIEFSNIQVIDSSMITLSLPAVGPVGPVGLIHQGDWVAAVLYAKNDAVLASGRYFVSRINSNAGHVPPVSPSTGDAWWALVVDANVAANTSLDAIATNADVALTHADAALAESSAAAAEAAWTAALAANPDLNPALRMNPSTLSVDMVVPAGFNGYSAGPLTIGEGVNITVGDNVNWNIF